MEIRNRGYTNDSMNVENNYQRLIGENTTALAWISGPNAHCYYLNKLWYRYTGQVRENGLGFGWLEALHPDDKLPLKELYEKSAQVQRPFHCEVRLRNQSGDYRWFLNSAQPYFDGQGEFAGYVGTVLDHHDRKLAEEALQDHDWRQNDFLEAMPHKILIAEPGGKIIKCNRRWKQYIGEELDPENQSCIDKRMYHPDDYHLTMEKWNFAARIGEPFELEHRIRRFDGQHRWHLGKAQPLRSRDGKIISWIWTNTDIEEQKNAQEDLLKSQKKLRENEERYRMIFQHSPVIYTRVDKNLRYEWLLNQHSDFSYSDFIGKRDDEFSSGPGITALMQLKQHVLDTGVQKRNEISFGLSDGRRTYDITATPVFDEENRITGLITAGLDVTERKKAEEEVIRTKESLANERELLQTIYDTIPVMLTVWEPGLNVVRFNKHFVELTGWTEEDVVGKELMELVYPDPEYREKVSRYMSSLTPGFKDLEMTTKNGQILESSWANVRISDGRNVGIGIDISHRKAFEQKLLELSRKLHTVIDNITDGVLVFGPEGEIIEKNKAVINIMTRFTDDPDTLKPDDLQYFDQEGKIVPYEKWPWIRCQKGESFIKEAYLVVSNINGKEAYLEHSGIPVFNKGKLSMAILTVQDITERKRDHLQIMQSNRNLNDKNLQLQKLNQFQENLLYVIAHDLRGPIANMQFLLDLEKSFADGKEKDDFVVHLRRLVHRQDKIIIGMVKLLEAQSEKETNITTIVLEELVRDLVRENEPVLKSGVGTVNCDFSKAPVLRHISSYVAGILGKLISNSINYRKEGVPLVIDIDSSIQNEYVLVRVKDNGTGIDLKRHGKQMFRPFKRFSDRETGTGISLYMIRNMIEENGGHIEVESEPGSGSCFFCYFKPYDQG